MTIQRIPEVLFWDNVGSMMHALLPYRNAATCRARISLLSVTEPSVKTNVDLHQYHITALRCIQSPLHLTQFNLDRTSVVYLYCTVIFWIVCAHRQEIFLQLVGQQQANVVGRLWCLHTGAGLGCYQELSPLLSKWPPLSFVLCQKCLFVSMARSAESCGNTVCTQESAC